MKHPFFTLYYTGLGISISTILIVGLFATNFSNFISTFSQDIPASKTYDKETDTKIFNNLSLDEVKGDKLPEKPKVKIETKQVITPTQQPVTSQSVPTSVDTSKKEEPTVIDSLK